MTSAPAARNKAVAFVSMTIAAMASESGAATTEPSIRKLIVRPRISGSVRPWTHATTTTLIQPLSAPMTARMTATMAADGARPTAPSPTPARSTNASTIEPNRRGRGSEPAARTPTSDPAPYAANRNPSVSASPPNRTSTSHGNPTTTEPVNARLAAVERTTIERITGSPRTTRPPSTRDARIDGPLPAGASSSVGAVPPDRTNQSMSAANANVAASTANAAPTPTSATAIPAIAGP